VTRAEPFQLDRMAIEEVGANPERLAAAVHHQLPGLHGAVPVYEIARALDIEEIREEGLTSFEGALITTLEKGRGSILVNANSSRQRRRYTVGHELGHFLNPWHKPTTGERFECTRSDMLVSSGEDRHLRQEAEANRFSIELLAPRRRLAPYLSGAGDLERVLALAADFDISKEAAARRYVALHDEMLAVVFARGNMVRYIDRKQDFPTLSFWKDKRLPATAGLALQWGDVDQRDWLTTTRAYRLSAAMLQQANGFAIILLRAEGADHDEEGDEIGGVDEPPKFRRR
jgi:IrrE N-terminal-like domain